MGIFDKLRGKKTDTHDHDHDHAGHSHEGHSHSHEDAHLHEGAPGATHDPVCDMWVDPAKAPAKSEHAGQTLYFCSPGCKRAFDKEPAKFMAKLKRA